MGGRWASIAMPVFATFVDALRARGMPIRRRRRRGRIAVRSQHHPWKLEGGHVGSDYAAPVDALAYNENVVGVVIDDCEHPLVTTDPLFVPRRRMSSVGTG